MARLLITWVKRGIGYNMEQKRTLKALGFRRLNQGGIHNDSGSIRGMINKGRHLVKVEEKTDEAG